ncbi:MAG TPA: translation initiation factor IF-2 [Lachnospiraceae bacterium]|nr:translation initiation factor IF-2 [Lachnospiraceae bacterium]
MNLTLHLTDNCNMDCSYCIREKCPKDMTEEVLYKACDLAFAKGGRAGLCFFGGEPLLRRDLIYKALDYCEQKSRDTGIKFECKMTTNGTLLDEAFLSRAAEVNMGIGLSFDGTAQDVCRVFKGGLPTSKIVENKAKLLLQYMPEAAALATIAPQAVPYYEESVRYLHGLGFKRISAVLAYGSKVNWTDNDLEKLEIQIDGTCRYIKELFMKGEMVTVNHELPYDKAEAIAMEHNIRCEHEEQEDVIGELLKEEAESESDMVTRPPVICVMGHVDHGKTSLLDAIRSTHVIDREAGGITQHIGAYVVNTQGRKITFLDTPGHEAFTAMRMRGANSTDIAILVVAADDGVMPQTVEAINHAKAAGIEIIVAVNKIDKPSANVDRVKQELSEYDLIPEDWGGSTVFVPVSAKTGEGIDQLLEMILLTADILELKANPKRRARGLVIEAELDKGRGPVATVLVQKGTLKVGDFIACGPCHGKVRAMIDDKGRRVREAGPSTPVEILGLNDVPGAGEIFISPENDKEAKNFAETFIAQNKMKLLDDTKSKMSLDDLFSQIKEGNLKELNLIVKADVQGSVEAVKESLVKLSNDEVIVKVIHGGVGAINESDVTLASASNAIIIGFNVRPDATAKGIAETEGVDLRLYSVIYKAIEDVELAMKGMLDPVFEERIIGHAEIRQIFKASGIGNIAGSYVLDGVFERGCKVRISRAGEQIFEGNLASLKRFKDDVKEVKAGYECGLVFENFGDIAELDIVEAYKMVEVPRK